MDRSATNAKGRDEQRKLRAAYLNNLAVAAALAAVLRPLVRLMEGGFMAPGDVSALLILGGSSYMLHALARFEVRRMEV